MLNTPFWNNASYNFFEQMWDGSGQVTVTIRNLMEGFKSLETGFYEPNLTGFRDLYAKAYSHTA